MNRFLNKIHEIWNEHQGAVMFMDDVPILRFDKNELPDEQLLVVLTHFVRKGHEYWFDYYD